MGTRYDTQDFVEYNGDIMVVVDIEGHRTDSPIYIVEKDRLNATTHRVKASKLSKVELNGYHPDTIVTDIEEEAEKQANRQSALVWSNNGRHEEADMIIAQFGEFYGVDGHDVQRHKPDTNGMERISNKGGSIPSAEAEVDIQEVCHEVSKNYKHIPRESIDRIAKAEFGSAAGMTYIVTSGNAMHFKKASDSEDIPNWSRDKNFEDKWSATEYAWEHDRKSSMITVVKSMNGYKVYMHADKSEYGQRDAEKRDIARRNDSEDAKSEAEDYMRTNPDGNKI